ncbi:tumor necrosis factor ligand superfamily member 18 [Archocentrus centrarchus]|uniref:tumor necrosis factor ligand superfamily member 18 n=1 Tax=Archocentrus centrarchus TaxID=63155 RepID=UPI0011E9B954|nr:uncharacterized protein LOC115784142 [Archocentrus centrarchus]
MPQRTQNFLIHILLLWTTLISIIQIAIIIFLFTAGQKGLDSSAVEPSQMPSVGTVNSLPSNKLVLGEGKMLTFKATKAEGQIKWTANRPDDALILERDKHLMMMVDGYLFLNLQVTLSAKAGCTGSNNCNVSLVKIQPEKTEVVLQGLINKETLSTGILSKVEELGAGEKLVVNMTSLCDCVDDNLSKTHLDIIFMLRPQMSVK